MNNTLNENLSINSNIITDALGSYLTENFSVVIAEQIKNARDANATNISIDFSDYKNKIIIEDDGIGINYSNIKNTWLNIGTNNKYNDLNQLGGKGIGRLTLFALGNTINVSTTHKNINSKFVLNKKQLLENKTKVEDIIIPIKTTETDSPQGTKIKITNIVPDIIDIKKIYIDLKNLIIRDKLKVNIIPYKDTPLPELLEFDKAINYSSINDYFKIQWDKDNFKINHKVAAKILNKKKSTKISPLVDDKLRSFINNNKEILKNIGNIEIYLYNFYQPRNFPYPYKETEMTRRKIKDHFLIYSSGVNIYRNNFKLFGYGTNDWLNLNEHSRNNTSKVSNSNIVGQIILSKESANLLIEKSNREGLINSRKEYVIFEDLIKIIIEIFNDERINNAKDTLLNIGRDIEDNKITVKPNSIKKPIHENIFLDLKEDTNSSKKSNSNLNNISKENVHPQIKLKNKKIKESQPCQVNINLNDFIDFNNSFDKYGNKLSENDLIFKRNNSIIPNGNLLPQDSPKNINITVTKINNDNLSNNFTLSFVDKSVNQSRNDLFILDVNGNYFRLQDKVEIIPSIMRQLNILWSKNKGEYDYVIKSAIRTLIDIEIYDRIIPQVKKNEKDSNNEFIIKTMGSELFTVINNIINFINGNKSSNLKKQIANKLGILDNNGRNNFYRSFSTIDNKSFTDKLRVAHIGAHNPTRLSNDQLKDTAKNITKLLELCEGYIAVLDEQ